MQTNQFSFAALYCLVFIALQLSLPRPSCCRTLLVRHSCIWSTLEFNWEQIANPVSAAPHNWFSFDEFVSTLWFDSIFKSQSLALMSAKQLDSVLVFWLSKATSSDKYESRLWSLLWSVHILLVCSAPDNCPMPALFECVHCCRCGRIAVVQPLDRCGNSIGCERSQ